MLRDVESVASTGVLRERSLKFLRFELCLELCGVVMRTPGEKKVFEERSQEEGRGAKKLVKKCLPMFSKEESQTLDTQSHSCFQSRMWSL